MKKLLYIPSWYPSVSEPYIGQSNREQIQMFSNQFDLKILVGSRKKDISRLKKVINTIKYILFKKVSIKPKEGFFESPPKVNGFEYELGLNILRKMNHEILKKAYIDYFKKFIYSEWKPNLIHAQNTWIAGIIAYKIKECFNIPYVITDRHHLNTKLKSFEQNDLIFSLLNARSNIFLSNWQYKTYLLLNENIHGHIIGNSIDEHIFSLPGKDPTLEKSAFIITHVSNAQWTKDSDTLFAVINDFINEMKSYDNLEVRIIGFPTHIIRLFHEQFGRTIKDGIVKFLPPMSKENIISNLHETDVFLFTSIFESFGIAPLEAMFCGVPVVSTDNGGINEYLVEGVNGIRCPLKDSDSIVKALFDIYYKRIVFDPVKVRESVVQKFSQDLFQFRMMQVYNSI